MTIPKTVRKNAKYCLRGYNSIDKYTLAISTYALTLLDYKDEINRSIERLLEMASKYNTLAWWETPGNNIKTYVSKYIMLLF